MRDQEIVTLKVRCAATNLRIVDGSQPSRRHLAFAPLKALHNIGIAIRSDNATGVAKLFYEQAGQVTIKAGDATRLVGLTGRRLGARQNKQFFRLLSRLQDFLAATGNKYGEKKG